MKLLLNYKKVNGKRTKVYRTMPIGWKVINGAMTAPVGYKWICNGKSVFSGEYEHGLLKEVMKWR